MRRWVRKSFKSKIQKQVILVGVVAVVYHVWRCINECYWSHSVAIVSSSIKGTKSETRVSYNAVMRLKITSRDQ